MAYKRSRIILTITAIVVFVIAFVLDITFFGQDSSIWWENVEVTRILSIVSIVVAAGLLLGLFLLRKQKYKRRIWLTIPIAFILFSCADVINLAISYYGLNEEYNYFSAKRDIQNGKIQILQTGFIMPEPGINRDKQQIAVKEFEKQFGYASVYIGCVATHGIGIYNAVMEEHLEKVNGKNWQVKNKNVIDSLMKTVNLQ